MEFLQHTSEQLGALLERGMSGEVVCRYEGPIMLFIYLYYHSESAAPAIIDTEAPRHSAWKLHPPALEEFTAKYKCNPVCRNFFLGY